MKKLIVLSAVLFCITTNASDVTTDATKEAPTPNVLDELDPFAPDIEEQLEKLDAAYEEATGLPSQVTNGIFEFDKGFKATPSCYREKCPIYLAVSKAKQVARLYVNGVLEDEFLVSTGASGHRTPDFDTHPNGRIYDRYMSKSYPGGDYRGLGNMPYAVFISGGFAVHGTAKSNWPKLGKRASHGCIRVHPDNGYTFNRLVRQYGIRSTWITVK